MTDFIFHIFVIGGLALCAVKGFRDKLTEQVPGCFGIAFGILCSYIFRFPVEDYLATFIRPQDYGADGVFVLSNFSCILIFLVAYTVFYICTYVLKYFFRILDTGILDNITGAVFGMLQGAVFISIALNVWLCLWPESRLLKYAMHDDGDIVHEVMLLAPFMLGSESVDELAHKIQLEKAKTIS